jgi:guanylate kinase
MDPSVAEMEPCPANSSDAPSGRLVVFSGPSGVGKTTVLRGVFEQCRLPLVLSVSATTRPPRPGERDGVDYYFLAEEEFESRRRQGDFLECFQVFDGGHWYGTLSSEVHAALASGKWVVLEIDVKGALAVMEQFPDALTFFIEPGSAEELERRLRGRGTENEEAVCRRLARARDEMATADRYRFRIANERVDQAVKEILDTLNQEAEKQAYAR